MPSYETDPRCLAIAEALVPLLRRSCPVEGGGFGGAYRLKLDDDEALGLGGVELLRAAMQRAARSLSWQGKDFGWIGRFGTIVGVVDRREVPEPFAPVVEQHLQQKMMDDRDVARARRLKRLSAQEFRAAVAERLG